MGETSMKSNNFIEGTPRKGDVLFRSDSGLWRMDAILDYRPGNDYTYRQGYRRAGRLLTEWVAEKGRDQDFLVFPICHAYRHFVELTLKTLMRIGCSLAERELTEGEMRVQTGSHNLRALWDAFKTISAEAEAHTGAASPPKEDLEGVEDYIDQLHSVDEGSYAFRYPLNKTGELSLGDISRINLGHFCDYMERLCNYLDGYEIFYKEMIDQRHEIVNSYGPDLETGDY
jgi:hypothetical protein